MSSYVKKHGEVITLDIRNTVSNRYHFMTAAINTDFWNSSSTTDHTLYVGSYGRGTAVNTSDVDVLAILPADEYCHYNELKGNSQSRLLQAVKSAIERKYPRTDVHADGQVVVVQFTDGVKFEVLPAFERRDYFGDATFTYPDSNKGGIWKSTNPKAEQEAISEKDNASNGLLKDTCKHIRSIRNERFSSYHLPGILIDSFVYHAMGNWRWACPGEKEMSALPGTYEDALLEYFNAFKCIPLTTPGSNITLDTDDYPILGKVLEYMVG